jgi:hypothetical protein
LEWHPGRRNRRGMIYTGEKQELAYRVSYRLFKGEIPTGMCVCHHCDNPRCIEPSHLFLGTQRDNMADMRAKNRGSKPPIKRTKVSPEAVVMIDRLREMGWTYKQIGYVVGTSKQNAIRIHQRKLVTLVV